MNRRQRTLDGRAHQAGRFRPEAVTNPRRRPIATIGELMLYKQIQRAERGRRRNED